MSTVPAAGPRSRRAPRQTRSDDARDGPALRSHDRGAELVRGATRSPSRSRSDEEAMRVLLVDGEERNAAIATAYLEAFEGRDVEVRRAHALAEAIARAGEEHFDVVLLDLNLPDCATDEPVARFRRAVDNLPVVVLTSVTDDVAGMNAVRQGAEELLIKDNLSPEALRRSIRHAIERRIGSLLLERSNRALETFAHTIAHEIRSPLSTMTMTCELLARQDLDEAGKRHVERIRGAVSEVDGIIRGLLEYASTTHGAQVEDVDLNDLVAEIAESLPAADPASEAFDTGSLPRVRGVRSQLRLVLANLIRNALEYACADEPRVLISAARRGRAWEIRVDDNGAGIPADERERVFEMFYRSPGRSGAGAGLGLAICRRSIESLGGTIAADSAPLGGCRVRFTLPDEPLDPSREYGSAGPKRRMT